MENLPGNQQLLVPNFGFKKAYSESSGTVSTKAAIPAIREGTPQA